MELMGSVGDLFARLISPIYIYRYTRGTGNLGK